MKAVASIQIKVDGQFVIEPKDIADAFTNCFKSIFNSFFLTVTPPYSVITDFYLWHMSLLLKSAGL
jgi:hypothetical protein